MTLSDFTYTRRRITQITSNGPGGVLLQKTCARVHALSLFHSVGPKIRKVEAISCPACVITPIDITEEPQLANRVFDISYGFTIGFVVKSPKDAIVTQQVIRLAELIRAAFLVGDNNDSTLVYSDVDGHYKTEIKSSIIAPIEFFGNNMMSFSSGINIVYSLYTSF